MLAQAREAPHRSQMPVEKAGRAIRFRHRSQSSTSITNFTAFLRIDFVLIGQPCVAIGVVTHAAFIGPASLAKAVRVNDSQDTPLTMTCLDVYIPNRFAVHLLELGQWQRLIV